LSATKASPDAGHARGDRRSRPPPRAADSVVRGRPFSGCFAPGLLLLAARYGADDWCSLSGPSHKYGDAPRAPRRPAGKARRVRISGISERGATQPAGMHRRPKAGVFMRRAANYNMDTKVKPCTACTVIDGLVTPQRSPT